MFSNCGVVIQRLSQCFLHTDRFGWGMCPLPTLQDNGSIPLFHSAFFIESCILEFERKGYLEMENRHKLRAPVMNPISPEQRSPGYMFPLKLLSTFTDILDSELSMHCILGLTIDFFKLVAGYVYSSSAYSTTTVLTQLVVLESQSGCGCFHWLESNFLLSLLQDQSCHKVKNVTCPVSFHILQENSCVTSNLEHNLYGRK